MGVGDASENNYKEKEYHLLLGQVQVKVGKVLTKNCSVCGCYSELRPGVSGQISGPKTAST